MPLRPLTTKRAQQARASATGTGTAGAPNPKDESGTQAPPPAETSVPYERTKPSRQRTIAELCSTKETSRLWSTRDGDPGQDPTIMCDLPKVPLRDEKISWETLLTGKVVISQERRLTIATTTKTRNQAGQVLREEEQVRATLWVGGLHAFLQHAIRLSFYKREVSEANAKLCARACQTIYDAAAKRAHNSTWIVGGAYKYIGDLDK